MIDPAGLNDLYLLALCIWREARGEPLAGKFAVGCVIRNRVRDARWPSSYRDVILQKLQFSSFNRSDPQVALYPTSANKTWSDSVHAAMATLHCEQDYAQGANHYYATSIAAPSWADPAKLVAEIGAHRFYKL